MSTATHFRPEAQPVPEVFWRNELGELGRRDHKGWAKPKAGCPFHESKSKMSFSVNLIHGGWCCFAGCGSGDMISFVRRRYGLNFRDACRQLGCWQNGQISEPIRRVVVGRDLVCRFVAHGAEHVARVHDDPRDERDLLRRVHHEAADRLHELHHGDPEKFACETETQWGILAGSWELLQLEARR